MFGWSGFSYEGAATVTPDPDAEAKKEAMAKIELEGVGVCMFCKEDIVKNEGMHGGGWVWESEFMLGWCDGATKDHKHKPQVVWTPEEGVHNV